MSQSMHAVTCQFMLGTVDACYEPQCSMLVIADQGRTSVAKAAGP